MNFQVNSPFLKSDPTHLISTYTHRASSISKDNNSIRATLKETEYEFKTERKVGKVGLMIVGISGNNGSTLVGGIIANKYRMSWPTKKGEVHSNFLGSMTQCSTIKIGDSQNQEEGEIYMKVKDILPMVDPKELVIAGWDINSANLAEAAKRAQIFDLPLQEQLKPYLQEIVPMPSIYYPDFIASNQSDRANNLLPGDDKWEHFTIIRENIHQFKKQNELDRVVVLWTANTERFVKEIEGVNDTYENLIQSLKKSHSEIAPSTIFAMAAMEENCIFINGSPQNTFVEGIRKYAESQTQSGILIGNDFKTGQTKFKTAFIDFLVGAGIKPKSIVSYNHLGNNDGKNLSSEAQFKSKELSKSECISDMLKSSNFYEPNTYPEHTVVIKYVPHAGDSKKAIDQYSSEIFMGGEHTFVSYNVCEDSLLAAGVIIDLIVLGELMARVQYKKEAEDWKKLRGVVSFLGYLTKAPESKGPIINALNRQRNCIQNLVKVLSGLPLQDHLLLNYRL